MRRFGVRAPRIASLSIHRALAVMALAIGIAEHAHAFRVNTYTTGDQSLPAVAALRDGSFIVTWKGADDRTALALRRYDQNASPTGAQLPLVAARPSERIRGSGALAPLVDGGFLAVWAASRLDSGEHHLYGRVFDATAAPVSRRFRIVKRSLPPILRYDVAVTSSGRGLVVWQVSSPNEPDVAARRIRRNGRPLGAVRPMVQDQTGPVTGLIAQAARRFVMTWHAPGGPGSDGSEIFARIIKRSGARVTAPFQINTFTTGDQADAAAAATGARSFVVVWNGGSAPDPGHSQAEAGIRAARFDRRGNRIGSEFRVNAYATGPHFGPRVSARSDGDFVVAWNQGQNYDYYYPDGPRCGLDVGGCQDGSGYGVIARTFGADAVARSDDVAATGHHDQLDGDIALNDAGRFVVVWRDADCLRAENSECRYSMGADGSGDSIEIGSGSLTMSPPWSTQR